MADKEKAPTRKEMDELYEIFKDEVPSGFNLPVGKEGKEKIMKALRKIRGMKEGGPAAPIMPEKAKKIRKYRNTRNDKTSLPKQVRDFIAAQESGSMPDDAIAPKEKGATLQELYDQGLIKGKRPKNMQKGGMAGSRNREADMRQRNEMRKIREMMMGESGASLSDRDRSLINQLIGTDDFIPSRKDVGVRGRQMIMDILGGAGRPMSDADRQLVNDIMRARNMEEGGEAVPAKFKGFSKLPEKVQKKMDPNLAQKYKKGGAVGSCRGMGAALRGGKFSGVK